MYRKIEQYIKEYLLSKNDKILCIVGARQIGKTYIISKVIHDLFENCIEINFDADEKSDQYYKNIRTIQDFYIQLSINYGNIMDKKENTVIFLDEIQIYPQYFSLLKQLSKDGRYTFICSGSSLGVEINDTGLSPMGSITIKNMYPMDFEEFMIANGTGEEALSFIRKSYKECKSLSESLHNSLMSSFYAYLYTGGLPDCVKTYVEEKNVMKIKDIQKDIHSFYKKDASKYDKERGLSIKKIYDILPSNIDNKVKRIQYKTIENIDQADFKRYQDDFEYLTKSGIVIECKAISEPKYPLIQSSNKNLIKLYMNDVGILTYLLYRNNINAILQNRSGVNLGAVYETAVIQELTAHGHTCYYYDRKKVGEVDFLIDDYENLCTLPIEVKSGKEGYTMHAMPKLLETENYRMKRGIVLSNDREVKTEGKIIYMPIYYSAFI